MLIYYTILLYLLLYVFLYCCLTIHIFKIMLMFTTQPIRKKEVMRCCSGGISDEILSLMKTRDLH